MSAESLARLVTMHAYCRPAGSVSEAAFIARYIRPLGATRDRWGNWSVVVGDNPRVAWSCHTDTVHRRSGSQRLQLSASGILSAPPVKLAVPVHHAAWSYSVQGKEYTRPAWVQTHADDSGCLGADDTAGCWLLCELIRLGVPGRYLFHYGEEEGCQGSRSLAADGPDWVDRTDMVIAVDRKGTGDVITHQVGARTCSNQFAWALADQLNAAGLQYRPSDAGLYTDSESYAGLIPECTNLSIGYAGNHSQAETLDTGHCLRLLEALAGLDVVALPVVRNPAAHWSRDAWGDWRDGSADTGALSIVYTSDDDFPDDTPDLTMPVACRPSVRYRGWCRDCGAGLVSEYEMVCAECGCDDPGDVAFDDDDSDETRAADAQYLDRTMARVQRELRLQLQRGDR